jgi:Uma2 family endonuclease
MVAHLQRRRARYQDVLDAPEHLIAEILNGELILQPRPAIAHQRASSELGVDLGGTVGRRGPPDGWIILDEPEVHLTLGHGSGPPGGDDPIDPGDIDVVVPDLAGWRRSRLPRVPSGAFVRLAPDWVCEVLSPATELRDRTTKMGIYARAGVSHLWFVAVRTRHVEVYRLSAEGLWTLLGAAHGEARVRLAPFEEVELELSRLWTEDAEGPA